MEPVDKIDKRDRRISVIIPALNEGATIASVVRELRQEVGGLIREYIVVDNGSTDGTCAAAAGAGARVVSEPRRGYGSACAAGAAQADPQSAVFLFMDGDGSDVPADIPAIVEPVLRGDYDFVLGSRIRGDRDAGSLLASQVFAGWMGGAAMRLLYGVRYTDMGPLRAISREALAALHMTEMTYGWNLEMQMKAAKLRLRILEIPVGYRCRQGGISKVAGSFQGSIKAASRIIRVMLKIALQTAG